MAMTGRAIRNWEVRQLRHMYHMAKLLKVDTMVMQYIDAKLEEHGAKPESARMKNIHNVMSNARQMYDKV